MRRNRHASLALASSLALLAAHAASSPAAESKKSAYAPRIDPAAFQSTVDNPYLPLVPGTRFLYRERSRGKTYENEVVVTRDTKVCMGVRCVVVHDVVRDGGVIREDTFDWYAQDQEGNVWYFGEQSRETGPHGQVTTEGSWEAGVRGGQPGIIMKARPAVGPAYRQEYLPGHAEDMGQVISVGDSVTVPFGTFRDCVTTRDWSPLESGSEKKRYARGVGLVRSESSDKEIAELISVTRP
jgi:hypothetical protein